MPPADPTPKKGFGNAWREWWNSMSTVPEAKKLKTARYRQFGDIGRAERIAMKLHSKLEPFDMETKKDIFGVLDGRLEITDLPVEARLVARQMQERTKQIGKMLVRRNIISQSTYDEMEGQYIHYMYARHIVGDGATIETSSGKVNLSYTKQRNPDLTLDQRRELGLIEDAGIAVPVGMGKALNDIAKWDYLDAVAKSADWTWQPSRVAVDGQTWGIGRLAEEVDAMKAAVKQFPDHADMAKRLATLEKSLADASEATKNIPDDFVQLSGKRYGPLDGAFVAKPIADDITPLIHDVHKGYGRVFDVLRDINERGMAAFKVSKVALNFPTAVRNMVSNVIQNNMRGRSLAKIPNDYRLSISSMLNHMKYKASKGKTGSYEKFYVEADRNGLFRTNWAMGELSEVFDAWKQVDGSSYSQIIGALKKVAGYYGKIDDVAKYAIYHQLRRDGSSIEDAVLEAQKWGMDYSLANRSVKHLRRHLMPFSTYQYKIAPLIAESIKKRPWVLGKYLALPTLIMPEVAKDLHDITPDEWKRMKSDLPEYIRKNRTYMILPWKSPEGAWQWVDIQYFFPWGNWMHLAGDFKDANLEEFTKDIGIGNPFLDLFVATKTGEDAFTHQPIVNPMKSMTGNQTADEALQWLSYVYTKWAPSMLTSSGALGYTSRIGKKDKWGRTVSAPQAMGRWFGLNTVAVSPQQTIAIRKARERELRGQLMKIERDPQVSKSAKAAARKRFIRAAKAIRAEP